MVCPARMKKSPGVEVEVQEGPERAPGHREASTPAEETRIPRTFRRERRSRSHVAESRATNTGPIAPEDRGVDGQRPVEAVVPEGGVGDEAR